MKAKSSLHDSRYDRPEGGHVPQGEVRWRRIERHIQRMTKGGVKFEWSSDTGRCLGAMGKGDGNANEKKKKVRGLSREEGERRFIDGVQTTKAVKAASGGAMPERGRSGPARLGAEGGGRK